MALTYQESKLVRSSVPVLREHGETVSRLCYSNLLRKHPDLQNFFNPTNQSTGRQPRAFTAVILAFAANINHMSELVPLLERMCHKHCSLSIKPEHYELMAPQLILAFAQVLGPTWTPELQAAWTKAYWVLAKMLITRERQMYGEFGNWKGWRDFRIDRKVLEGDGVFSLYLKPCDLHPLVSFLPGHYLSIRIKIPSLGRYHLRQYSLSEVPNPNFYRITIKRLRGDKLTSAGVVSSLLDNKQVGDVLQISRPTGEFFLEPEPSNAPIVLMSAGIGATPMISILNRLVERGDNRPVSYIHCSTGKAPFEDHVRRIASSWPALQTKFFRSQATVLDKVDTDADYEEGRLDLAKIGLDKLHLDHSGTEYFICGPELLMEDIDRFLRVQGVDQKRIRCEKFSTGDLEFKTYSI